MGEMDAFLRMMEVSPLIDGLGFDGLIADKAFSNALVAELNERGAKIVISQHPGRAQKLKIDAAIYTWRNLVEKSLCKFRGLKRSVMRACKTGQSFQAMIYTAAVVIKSP